MSVKITKKEKWIIIIIIICISLPIIGLYIFDSVFGNTVEHYERFANCSDTFISNDPYMKIQMKDGEECIGELTIDNNGTVKKVSISPGNCPERRMTVNDYEKENYFSIDDPNEEVRSHSCYFQCDWDYDGDILTLHDIEPENDFSLNVDKVELKRVE